MQELMERCRRRKSRVEEAAVRQARELATTIEAETRAFESHHLRQRLGWLGGEIDFPLKIDMLVKTYPSELAASMILHFPKAYLDSTLDLFRSLDRDWSLATRDRAAETLGCLLSLVTTDEARRLFISLTDGTKDLLGEAVKHLREEYETVIETLQPAVADPSMILIPAGDFIMGTSTEQVRMLSDWLGNWPASWFEREMPQRRVFLDAYWIDKYPVTNAQYKQFVDSTGHAVPYRSAPLARPYNWDHKARMYPLDKADHPVVLIDWWDAAAYAKWANKRLPTEAEWEKAARGTDGRLWPWGNSWDPALCNHGIGRSRGTAPVTVFQEGASPFGVIDMAGNVWEWCADGFDIRYHSNSNKTNPLGTGTGRVIRGASWYDEVPELYRCAVRDGVPPDNWEFYRGFRCVSPVALEVRSSLLPTPPR